MAATTDLPDDGMADRMLLEDVVRGLGLGLAVVDARDWSITFENARFFQWFPPVGDADAKLGTRLPDLDTSRTFGRLEKGRPFRFETEAKLGTRTVLLAVEVRRVNENDENIIVVECRDISKQKEAEYLLDSYSDMSERNARELQREKDPVEKLLLNIMPRSVYEEMRDYSTATPQKFESVSVLLLDFVNSTKMAISYDPGKTIAELNDIFSAFDRICELFGCERTMTIGDAHMAVLGLPEPVPDHADNIAKVALRMRRYLERRNAAHPETWECRIGINSGPVIGSLAGVQKYVYDIFGPGVNLAARMETYAEPMTITLTEDTFRLLSNSFVCSELGEHQIKGFGAKMLYTLDRETGTPGRHGV
jgi:class 3 adenylate cyclase